MQTRSTPRFVRFVLLSNGVVDLLAAAALLFPVLGLPLPGYSAYTSQLAFVAGGWAIAALTFGIGRIWTSHKAEFHRLMVVLGLVEAITLAAFCAVNVLCLGVSLLQAMLPLAVGSIYSVLYFLALLALLRLRKPDSL